MCFDSVAQVQTAPSKVDSLDWRVKSSKGSLGFSWCSWSCTQPSQRRPVISSNCPIPWTLKTKDSRKVPPNTNAQTPKRWADPTCCLFSSLVVGVLRAASSATLSWRPLSVLFLPVISCQPECFEFFLRRCPFSSFPLGLLGQTVLCL